MPNLRISVTGATGFFGGILCKLLEVPKENQFDITFGNDITETETQIKICQSSEVIIHLAAVSGLKACEDNPNLAKTLNTDSTIQLATMAKQSGCKRFIFASSSAVYGEAKKFVMDEDHDTDARSLYGQTKLEAEGIEILSNQNFEVVIFRQSNLYGYGTTWKGITVIDQFIDKYINKQSLGITGTGSQKRDFVHVMDVVSLYAKVAKANKVQSGVYNLGGGECISVRQLAEMVNDIGEAILGYRVGIDYKPANNEAINHDFKFSFAKAQMAFQYSPKLNLSFYIQERMMKHLRER